MSTRRLTATCAAVLWAIVATFAVLAFTVAPDAINAVVGIGIVAVLVSGFAVAVWLEFRRAVRAHPWGEHCGGIVWNRYGGGYNGVDGQCSSEFRHLGECQP